jgi:hypothetical protein
VTIVDPEADPAAGGGEKTVGVWEATCAPAVGMARKEKMQIGKRYFIGAILILRKKKGRERSPPPPVHPF